MAQPNVAREPSMDEILASIRKIIESNEPGIPGFPANDLGPGPDDGYRMDRAYDDRSDEDIHLTIDDEVVVSEFEAEEQRREFSSASQTYSPPPETARPAATTSSPPLSLADVAARVRAASERHSSPFREPENSRAKSDNPMVTARMSPVTSQVTARYDAATETTVAPPLQTEQPAVPMEAAKQFETSLAPPPETNLRETPVQDVPARDTPAQDKMAAQEQRKPLSIVSENDVAALVSPAVSEQVARSFGDLALALDNSARRSFDEIAEDMLRPMLQEWLDDNLPTLVERLVREEIERVARGPRR